MPFESISNRRLYRQIARQIIGLIDAGEYKPGERLPAERILAERLAVSRPTVREALLALEVENRVEIRGGSGVFVLDRPESSGSPGAIVGGADGPEAFEVLFARNLIEPDIAALAATNASPRHLAALAKALGDMVCCSADDAKRLDYDREFHLGLAQASGNRALLMTMKALLCSCELPLGRCEEDIVYSEQVWQRTVIEHREVLVAVKQGDARAARATMQRHMRNVRTRLMSQRREDSQPAPADEGAWDARQAVRQVGAHPVVIELDDWTTPTARSA